MCGSSQARSKAAGLRSALLVGSGVRSPPPAPFIRKKGERKMNEKEQIELIKQAVIDTKNTHISGTIPDGCFIRFYVFVRKLVNGELTDEQTSVKSVSMFDRFDFYLIKK
jgi:hypothetical protein